MSRKRPLIVILGCTGTGKSDLGVEIAKNFNGEVISADSMQIYKGSVHFQIPGVKKYHMLTKIQKSSPQFNSVSVGNAVKILRRRSFHGVVLGCSVKVLNAVNAKGTEEYIGLDIATNKLSLEEMNGVVHHMMSFVEPSTSTYNVHHFTNKVLSLLEDLWVAGKLPVIVGGTGYYTEGILFKENLIPTNTFVLFFKFAIDLIDSKNDFEDLSDDEVYELLKRVDLESAMQVHKNNRFRVVRALQIYYATGQRKSEYLKEQHRKIKLDRRLRFSNVLLFVLDARKELLEERLNERVLKMVEKGLRKEVEDFYEQYRDCLTVHGVAQSIAIKEFYGYLQLTPDERYTKLGDRLFSEGCEALKLHTRQYSRRQRRWIKQHLLGGSLLAESANIAFFDTSEDFHDVVVPNALNRIDQFLNAVSSDVFLSQSSAEESERLFTIDFTYRRLANQIYRCETCEIDVHGTINWEAHLKGKKHRKNLTKRHMNEAMNPMGNK
uniref:U1-type domain-containing protein n=1 Tax=Setaria digitata TaxID=48799 RepID=A0A915Q1S8_9BILA